MDKNIHNLVPQFILDQLTAKNERGSFTAVGLFVDISGFTQLMETLMQQGQHGAEVMASVMLGIFEPLVQFVFEQGGFVSNFAGDAFTAFFPIDTQDQTAVRTQQAVTAAWLSREHLRAHPYSSTPYGDFQMTAKFGLALGETGWGIISDFAQGRAAYYFRGTAVDGCAQAEKQAQPGEIVVDAALAAEIKNWVKLQPRNDHFCIDAPPRHLHSAQPFPLPAPSLSRLTRFFPKALITQPFQGEFRQIVNVFISLTDVQNEADLVPFMQTVFDLQAQFGSVTSRLDFGDKGCTLLLFWGAPIAHETDIERALSFLLALRKQSQITIRAGITYRVAHAGFIGSPLHEEFTCYGSGVNLAARFMTSAPPGEIWLDEEIFKRAQHHFSLQFAGHKQFKGFTGELPVYCLAGHQETAVPIFSGLMLGRKAELSKLERFVQPLAEGRIGGALCVEGEAGIGKSRLLHTFFDQLKQNFGPHNIFLCQTDQILRQSLNPMRYWLQRHFNQSKQRSQAENKAQFEQRLAQIIANTSSETVTRELHRTRSFLGALLDLHWPDSLYAQLEPQGRFENTLIALTTLLQAESLRQPTLLVIEDIHWLDADTRQFLQQLWLTVTAVPDTQYPLAILATSRPEQQEMADFGNFPWQTISLGQLEPPELNKLAAEILGGTIAPSLQKVLANQGEGNPFFTEQIVRFLQEQNLLEMGADGWQVKAVQQTVLPRDVHALLVARLDRLTASVKNGVQYAAVLGREFEVRLLALMLRDEDQFESILAEAKQATIWSALDELRYLFRHALVRDAAYKMQLRARRQTLHKLAVSALETLYAGALRSHYGEIAYHAEQADLHEKARDYLQKAGDVAREAYQNIEALDYYGRALALKQVVNQETKFQLLSSRENIYHLLGHRESQQEEINQMATLAGQLNDTPKLTEVYLRKARFAHITGEHLSVIAAAKKAIELAQQNNDATQLANAHIIWCKALFWQGDYAGAREHAQSSLNFLKYVEDMAGEEQAHTYLGRIGMHQGNYFLTDFHYRKGLQIAQSLGNRKVEGDILNNIGLMLTHQQNYMAAKSNFEQALALHREIGSREGEGSALNNLGIIAHVLGQYEEAYFYYEQSLFISREVGTHQEEAIALNNLGEVAAKQQKHPEAVQFFLRALEIERETGARYLEAHTATMLGFTQLEIGQTSKAEIAFLNAMSLRKELGQDHLAFLPQLGLICIRHALGRLQNNDEDLNTILGFLNKANLDGLEDPFNTIWVCYRILSDLQDHRADGLLVKAYTLLLAQAGKIPDDFSRQSFLINIPEHRLIVETAISSNIAPDVNYRMDS